MLLKKKGRVDMRRFTFKCANLDGYVYGVHLFLRLTKQFHKDLECRYFKLKQIK